MSTDWRAGLGKFAIAIDLGAITVPCWESMVSAQIIPDETLGAESSKERQDILLLTSLLTEVLPHKIKTTKRDRHFAILRITPMTSSTDIQHRAIAPLIY